MELGISIIDSNRNCEGTYWRIMFGVSIYNDSRQLSEAAGMKVFIASNLEYKTEKIVYRV